MRGLYLAESAMLTGQARLNLISNNLANLKTAGYKRDEPAQVSFNEWLLYCRQPAESANLPHTPIGEMAHGVAVGEIRTDFTTGGLEETGRGLDFALDRGYFTVQGPEGELLYTRNGRFFLDEEGYLVTADHLPVLGEGGAIQLESPEITVDRGGTIYREGQPIARLQITEFPPDLILEKTGHNYFRAPGAGEILEDNSGVYWRYLENSNVDLTREMVLMLQTRRSYEAAQKVMVSYEQLLSRAANELGALS
ncbi:MAG: flagellar hook-basal body protein [Firmicutes bacterium]|nr:flagellar hook-basal body protein [Bacillota bacterium]